MKRRGYSCVRGARGNWQVGAMVATIGLMAGAAPAFAQDASPQSAETTASSGLGDIVVTARRKEEALQSVPIAIQAFSGEALSKQNVQDANDLQKLVPALTTYQQARDDVDPRPVQLGRIRAGPKPACYRVLLTGSNADG